MKPRTYITTSWDDGHPLDLRLADLLRRYALPATFYVPRSAPTPTLSPAQIRELSRDFELAAHTLNHVELTRADETQARQEIRSSKAWIEDLTGRPCTMFCPPLGRFTRRHLGFMRQAGYTGLRTVEFLSLDLPRLRDGLWEMPTTLQAYPHRLPSYARNLLRRRAFGSLWLYITRGQGADWPDLASFLLQRALQRGGVFHLWGHSWELQDPAQWQRLEEVLKLLHQLAHSASPRTNGQLCARPPA